MGGGRSMRMYVLRKVNAIDISVCACNDIDDERWRIKIPSDSSENKRNNNHC